MESECENTRRWLLQAERYEDVDRFDASTEARERFCRERGSYHHHDNVAVMEAKTSKEKKEQSTYNPAANEIEMMQKRIDHLEEMVKAKDDIIEDKDALILMLMKRLRRSNRL